MTVAGTRPNNRVGPKQFGSGRKCRECGGRVSLYNPADTCYLHTPMVPKQHRGRHLT